MSKKICISGWYGEKNLGDEMILESIVSSLNKRDASLDIFALSFDPVYTKKSMNINAERHFPYTLKSLLGSFIKGHPLSIIKTFIAVKNADLIIFGGGGFLSDWNPKALKPWFFQVLLYKKFLNKKVMMYGIGAGPFMHDDYKKKIKKYLDLVDIITVRDMESYKQLKNCGVTKQMVTADPVVDFPLKETKRKDRKTKSKFKVGLSIAPLFMNDLWNNHEEKYKLYMNSIIEFINRMNREFKENVEIIFIPMQDHYDVTFNKEIMNRTEYKENISIKVGLSNSEKIEQLKELDLLVGMRLHSIIIASLFGVPTLGVIYHHKIHQYLENIGMEELAVGIGDGGNWEDCDIDPNEMFNKFLTIYNNKPKYSSVINNSLKKMMKKNKINIEKAISLLD